MRASRATGTAAPWWHNRWLLAAASIILVVGTALITSTTAPGAKASKGDGPALRTPIQSVAVLAVERHYLHTLDQLRESLESQRPALSTAAVSTVDHALAVIDTAIYEARRAFAEDPGSGALIDILSAHYRRKVELLQRATELSL